MNELDTLITLAAVLLMVVVMGAQGYMLGNLLMGKLLEHYDIYMIKKKVSDGLCCCGDMEENHSPYSSNHAVVFAVDYGIENAKKWERG